MIYLDTSVALAHLLGEARRPSRRLFEQPLIASRLLQYELVVRSHALRLGAAHERAQADLLARVQLVDLIPRVLGRALEPFPVPVRTLDALHLATCHFLVEQGASLELATYDARLEAAARALDLTIWPG